MHYYCCATVLNIQFIHSDNSLFRPLPSVPNGVYARLATKHATRGASLRRLAATQCMPCTSMTPLPILIRIWYHMVRYCTMHGHKHTQWDMEPAPASSSVSPRSAGADAAPAVAQGWLLLCALRSGLLPRGAEAHMTCCLEEPSPASLPRTNYCTTSTGTVPPLTKAWPEQQRSRFVAVHRRVREELPMQMSGPAVPSQGVLSRGDVELRYDACSSSCKAARMSGFQDRM
jgi:hypothetical protein